MTKSKKNKMFLLLISYSLYIIIYYFIIGWIPYGTEFYYLTHCDFQHHRITAYVLHGINPYVDLTSLKDTVGKIPWNFATSPWGLTLNNLFYPGYLPENIGVVYYIILSLLFFTITTVCVYKYCREFMGDCKRYVILICITGLGFFYSISCGNSSSIIGCMLVLAIIYHDKYPIISGVLLGFAMTKPQYAGLICLTLLLEKKFKPLITCSLVCIAGYASSCILLKTGPLTLLKQFLDSPVGGESVYYGILSFLKAFNYSKLVILTGSALIGILLTVFGYKTIKNIKVESTHLQKFLLFCPAIFCTQIWSYMFNNDTFMLIIPVIVLLFLWINDYPHGKKLYIWTLILHISPRINNLTANYLDSSSAGNEITSIIIVIIYYAFLRYLTNNTYDSNHEIILVKN